MPKTTRASILQDATDIVCKDRNKTHGEVEDSFRDIAAGWSIILGMQVKPYQVALLMDWLKTARLMSNPTNQDSWIDKAGYSACGGELALKDSDVDITAFLASADKKKKGTSNGRRKN